MSALSLRKTPEKTTQTPAPVAVDAPVADVGGPAIGDDPELQPAADAATPTLDAASSSLGADIDVDGGPAWSKPVEGRGGDVVKTGPGATVPAAAPDVVQAAAATKNVVSFELTYPDTRGKGTTPKFLAQNVSFTDYARARAQTEAFLAKTRTMAPRGKEDHGEVLERRVLNEVWSYAYTMLSAAHAIHNIDGIGQAPEGSIQEKTQHTILLQQSERLMRRRSRDYFALLENIDRVPGRLQADSNPNSSPRTELLSVLSIAERELGLRGKLKTDLTTRDGGQGDARAARIARTFERHDAPRILGAFGLACRRYAPFLQGSKVTFEAKKGLPKQDDDWLEDAVEQIDALQARLDKAEEAAASCPPIPGAMLDIISELAKVKRQHRGLDRESGAQSARGIKEAEEAIGTAETVLSVSTWVAEQSLKVVLGPGAAHIAGLAMEAYKTAMLEPDKLTEKLVGQVLARGAGELVKGAVETGMAGALKRLKRPELVGTFTDKYAQDLTKSAMKNIIKKTVSGLADGSNPIDAVTGALKNTFSPKKVAEMGLKSFVKTALAKK